MTVKKVLLLFLVICNIDLFAFTIKGKIIDGITGEALENALVIVYNDQMCSGAATENGGSFTLALPDAAPVNIKVEYLLYEDHHILNIRANNSIIDIGTIPLAGKYITHSKPRKKAWCGNSYKWKLDLNTMPMDVYCLSGAWRFKWVYIKDDERLEVKFEDMRSCESN